MKKFYTYLIILSLCFFPLCFVHAETRFSFTEAENGVIDTKIHFDDGFVGGLDLSLKISDNVNVKDFMFNAYYKDFTTYYNYNKDTHMLDIKITSGGISLAHNLLNDKKELSLGKIYFETSSKENIDYNIIFDKLTVIDNNWDSKDVFYDVETLGNTFGFKYIVNNDAPQKDDEDKNDNKEDNDNNNNENNNENNSSVGNNNNEQVPNNKENENNKQPEVNNDTDKEEDNKTPNDNSENKPSSESDNKIPEEPTKEHNNIIIIVSGVIIIAVIGTIVGVIIKNKNMKF